MEKQEFPDQYRRSGHEKVPEKVSGASWQPGEVIFTSYRVIAKLGEGGMGIVHHVRHLQSKRDMAVKSPRLAMFSRQQGRQDFVREAETWVKLGMHPNIVSCYYVRTLEGLPRIFIEYVQGGSLSEWIRSHRLYAGDHQLVLQRLLDVAIQFAWGLHYSHEQGLVHQDVKPANVMMTVDGIPKVTDFGLAKARVVAGEAPMPLQEREQSLLVSWGGMTPAYSSPEQLARQALNRKTDIWSWAASVLQMFLGQVTWRLGPDARDALARHVPSNTLIPAMPPQVVKLLGSCLRPRPQDRPATMLEVAANLQAIYECVLGQPYPRRVPKAAAIQVDMLNNQAASLFELGRAEEALATFEQVINLDPTLAIAYYNKGRVLYRLQRREEALQAYEQYLRLIPDDAVTRKFVHDIQAPQMYGDRSKNLTDGTLKVLSFAQQEAERWQAPSVESEHLLLGLLYEEKGIAASILSNLHLDLKQLRSILHARMKRGDRPVDPPIELSARAKQVFTFAVDEAKQLQQRYLGAEFLLLGLLREGEGLAAEVLQGLGVSLKQVRVQVIEVSRLQMLIYKQPETLPELASVSLEEARRMLDAVQAEKEMAIQHAQVDAAARLHSREMQLREHISNLMAFSNLEEDSSSHQ